MQAADVFELADTLPVFVFLPDTHKDMIRVYFSDEDKQPIIDYCEQYIAKNGYVRIGWAVSESMKGRYFQGDGHAKAFYNSVSSKLVNTGKYVREPTTDVHGDWDVRLNPNYKKESWSDKNPLLHDIIICSVTFVFTLIVGIILWTLDNKTKSREMEQLKGRLDKIENTLKIPSKK